MFMLKSVKLKRKVVEEVVNSKSGFLSTPAMSNDSKTRPPIVYFVSDPFLSRFYAL